MDAKTAVFSLNYEKNSQFTMREEKYQVTRGMRKKTSNKKKKKTNSVEVINLLSEEDEPRPETAADGNAQLNGEGGKKIEIMSLVSEGDDVPMKKETAEQSSTDDSSAYG